MLLSLPKVALALAIMAYSAHASVVVCGSGTPAQRCVQECGCGCLSNPTELVCGDAGGNCSEDFLKECNADCGCQG